MSMLDELGRDAPPSGTVAGVAAGVVTNNRDREGLGRVKLKFPWLSDDNETGWVRVATAMAGGGRGNFFLPEVGDEVLVGFEHGDINSPYVIGSLWNGSAKPPEDNGDGGNNIRKMRSRSGHEVILDDTPGGEKIVIKDKTGSNAVEIDSVAGSIKIKAATVEIEATGKMTLKGAVVQIN